MTEERDSARALVEDLVTAYNAKDLESLASLYAVDARYWSALDDWSKGIDAIRSQIEQLFASLPDEEMAVRTLVTDGQWAVVEFLSTGTGPTGRPYEIEFTEVIELKEHRIISIRVYLDPLEVARAMD